MFRKGGPGDDFYVIESGCVAVIDDGREIRRLGPGEAFGGIALLRAVPRTASVRALEVTELAALSGPDFVSAVTGFSATSSTAEQLVSGHLAEGPRAPLSIEASHRCRLAPVPPMGIWSYPGTYR